MENKADALAPNDLYGFTIKRCCVAREADSSGLAFIAPDNFSNALAVFDELRTLGLLAMEKIEGVEVPA